MFDADASTQLDGLDRNLVFSFFWKFSTFECALKRGGFLKSGRNETAEVAWEKFEKSIKGRFDEIHTKEFHEAMCTLTSDPPRRQVVKKGEQLGWELLVRKDGETEEAFVLRLVRTVRNNLFHGGKYPDGPIEEVARNKEILQSAFVILDACYELHSGFEHFSETRQGVEG